MMAKRMKRTLALALSLVMVLGLLPAAAFAARVEDEYDSTAQIVDAGGTRYFKKDGNGVAETTKEAGDAILEITKSVAGTQVENEFEITLQVKTTEDLTTIPGKTPDSAVVLVLDVSNSMDDCAKCGKEQDHDNHTPNRCNCGFLGCDGHHAFVDRNNNGICDVDGCWGRAKNHYTVTPECVYEARLTQAKKAAKDFIDTFATQTGAQEGDKRLVQIIAFGSDAKTYTSQWYDVNDAANGAANITALKNIIGTGLDSGIRVGNGDGKGGTNIEGGLMLARNLLQAGLKNGQPLNGMEYLYTVLLTDGAPTFYVNKDQSDTKRIDGTEGGGNKTTTDDVRDVAGVASAIKGLASASKLFSIAYGKDVAGDKPFGSVSGINCPVPGTTWKKLTIGQWLGSFSTNAYEADDNQTLFDAFEAIGSTIRLAAQAWRVEDQMGANITYLGETTTGTFTNTVTPAEDGKSFQWNVLASGYDPAITTIKPAGSSEPSTYGYTMKYRVRLDNTDGSTTAYPTNTAATLKFMLTNDQGEWPSIGEGETAETHLKTVDFPVPTVKGNFGALRFTKVDKNTQAALPGVTFTLTCDCKDPAHAKIAASSDTGAVSFTDIPSGHTYTLTETLPEGDHHDPASIGAVTVKVSGGVVYVNGQKNPKDLKLENTYLPGAQDLTVTKQWGATPDGLQTAVQVVYEQYQNGERTAISDPVTLTAADDWTHTWNDVPVRDILTGEAYAYVVREYVNGAVAEGNRVSTINGKDYLVTYNDVNNIITNEIQNEMSIPVEKQWLTPDSMKGEVTVNLLRDGNPFQTLTLSGTKLSGAFEKVPVYAENGDRYTYSITETIAPNAGYSAHIVKNDDGSYTIQNVVNQTTVAVEGSKAWVDGNSGARPQTVEVSLWKTGSNTAQDTRTIGWNAETETYDWTYSFTGLDKYDLTYNETTGLWEGTGAEIEYYVTDDAEGYDPAIAYKGEDGQYNLTNKLTQVEMTISVTKTWKDEGFEDERPDSLTFSLYGADKENALATLVLNAKEEEQDSEEPGGTPTVITYWEDSTTGRFDGTFPKYDATGAAIGYTVVEAEPAHYDATVGQAEVDDATIHFPVKNTLNGDTTAVSVEKIWKDTRTNADRPKATIKLMDGSTVVDSIDLPRADEQGVLVNTYTFTDLTKYRDGGRIQYTVAEDTVTGYQTPVIAGSMETGYTVTNTVKQQSGDEGVTVSGTKSWLPADGIHHPASTTIQLQSDAAEANVFANVTGKTATATAEGGWTYTFTGLDRYAYDNGDVREIQYKVTDTVSGYETTGGARNAQGAYDLTNTFQQEFTSVSGKKVWVDGSSAVRPASVTVALLADGVEVDRQTVSAVEGSSEWAFTFGVSDGSATLPKYSAYNTAIAYTVREVAPDGTWVELPEGQTKGSVTYTVGDSTLTYDVTYGDNYTITNTKPQDYSDVTINKVWKDGSNAAGTRPATVSLTLLRNGSEYKTVTLGPNEPGTNVNGETWSHTFTGLPKYDDGRNAYRYTVQENGLDEDGCLPAAVEGERYTASVNGLTVTNTIQQKTISISGEKKWENTPENWVAPERVTIELYKSNGTVLVGSVDLPRTAADAPAESAPSTSEPVESAPAAPDWSYTFTGLPKYDRNDAGEGSGALIDYTLKEKGVLENGTIIYTVKSDGKDRKDTYQVEYKTNEDGTRDVVNTWKDNEYYSYLVKATYISKVNGTTTTVTDVQVAGGRGDANETIRIASGDYTTYGGHSDYEYVLGSAKLNGALYQEDQKNFSFVLDDSSVVETLELTYYREKTTPDPEPDPGPSGKDYYRVIVNYLEEGTDRVLATQYRSEKIREGNSWDVTEQTEKSIEGYERVRVDGEPTGRNIQSNVIIDVYYTAATEIPDQPTPGGSDPVGPQPTPGGETESPNQPSPADPGPDGGATEIVDEGTPMGNLPQTGTVAAPVDPSVTLGLMALSASLSAAGLAFCIGRKKEEEN